LAYIADEDEALLISLCIWHILRKKSLKIGFENSEQLLHLYAFSGF